MKKRLFAAIALAGVLSTSGLFGGTASAKTYQTREGLAVELTASQQSVRKIAPLDSMPTSGEALLSSNVHAAVKNIGDKKVKATLEIGYQIGYPVSVAPDGVDITLNTPDLTLSGGVNAKVEPNVSIDATGGGGGIGDVGVELGAESTVIPSNELAFSVKPGGITTVSLAEIALTESVAAIVLSGVNLHATNVLGPISVRPFAKISVTSPTGVYVYHAYGATSQI